MNWKAWKRSPAGRPIYGKRLIRRWLRLDFNAIKVDILENSNRTKSGASGQEYSGLHMQSFHHYKIPFGDHPCNGEHIDIRWYANNPAPIIIVEDEPQRYWINGRRKQENRNITVGHPY